MNGLAEPVEKRQSEEKGKTTRKVVRNCQERMFFADCIRIEQQTLRMSKLSDFNTIIQLGAAMHLLYAILEDVHRRPIAAFVREVSDAEDAVEKAKDQKLGFHFKEQLLFIRNMLPEWRGNIQKWIGRFIWGCVVVAALDSCALVLAAFQPELSVPTWCGGLLVAFLFLPMPIFLLITYSQTKFLLRKLRLVTETAKEHLSD